MSDTLYYTPGQTMKLETGAFAYGGAGLVGSLTVRLNDDGPNGGTDVIPAQTTGITWDATRKRHQINTLIAPVALGEYDAFWVDPATGGIASQHIIVIGTPPFVASGVSGIDLCALSDVRTALEMSQSDTSLDAFIQPEITAVSGELLTMLERELVPQSTGVTRRFHVSLTDLGGGQGVLVDLNPYDLRVATTVVLHPESTQPLTLSTAQYQLEPVPSKFGSFYKIRLSEYLSFLSTNEIAFGVALLDVTGDWGIWSSPPQWVRTAVAIAVKARIRLSAAPDVYQENPDQGQVSTPPQRVYSIPAATLRALAPLQRWS